MRNGCPAFFKRSEDHFFGGMTIPGFLVKISTGSPTVEEIRTKNADPDSAIAKLSGPMLGGTVTPA
jgi:hypothetical protein